MCLCVLQGVCVFLEKKALGSCGTASCYKKSLWSYGTLLGPLGFQNNEKSQKEPLKVNLSSQGRK